jgi:hypothetical protein
MINAFAFKRQLFEFNYLIYIIVINGDIYLYDK